MKLFKFKKIKYKTISYCLILTLIISTFSNVLVGATSSVNTSKTSGITSLFQNFISPLKKETKTTNSLIQLNEDTLPNIKVSLESDKEVIATSNDEIKVTYKISPQNFDFTSKNNVKSEVVFLLDTSKGMSGNRFNNMKNGFDSFKNTISSNDNIKIGVVAYNSKANALSFNNKYLTNDMEQLRLELLNLSTSQNNSRDIGKALEKASEILQSGDPLAEKTIVLLASGEVSSSINLDNIKSKNYNIISIQVDCGYPSQHSNNTLKNIHQSIGGKIDSDSYIINLDDHNNQNNANGSAKDHNNNQLNKVIESIPEKIKGLINSNYIINDAKLYFDLNDNFEVVGDSLTLVEGSSNKYYFNVPQIVYTANKISNGNGLYTYSANELNISFKIKVKEGKSGRLEFAENIESNINNYLKYTNINNILSNKLAVETPTIIVSDNLNIEATLIGNSPNYPYIEDEIDITYKINPEEFFKENTGEISLQDAKLIFNLGSDFTLIENQEGLTLDSSGNVILDLADKIKYSYDTNTNKYISEKFNVSFKVKATRVGDNITFASSKIKYSNILGSGDIENNIESPSITVRNSVILPEYNGPDIRILEIEPADSFKLTDSNTRTTTGVEEVVRTVGEKTYKIEITHMTMPEFIGKVDTLNGKYDVVVIGRYVDTSLTSPYGSVSNINDGEGKIWFRDYVDLENDITNKKATEIKNYINSGQLVFIDSDIANMNGSKLWWHTTNSDGNFNQSVDNLVKTMSVNSNDSNNKITINSIIDKYLNRINSNDKLVRPKVVSTIPEGDSHDDDLGKIYKRDMRFNIAGNDFGEENVTINLYLDIDGDGLFNEEEIVKQVTNVKISQYGYILDYNLYNDYPQFIGYLEWRIEVVKESLSGYSESIHSYVDGDILFRRLTTEKRVINVLQISPFDKWNLNSSENSTSQYKGGNLNLKTNANFQRLLKEKEVQDYEINIDVISYQDFYSGDYKGPGHDNLNGSKYHMIIMGFADTFLDRQLSQEAIEQLRSFVESGQGLMLTHDTLWYKSWDGWQNNIRNTTAFIKEFRDIIGQSRYIDPNNESEIGLNNEKITHDPNRPTNSYIKEAGATLLEINGVNNSNSTEVYRTNESLITNYPFELGETIRVRRTHGQYLQLNLEDEDVVPLFNLTENNSNNPGNNENFDWNNKENKVNRYDSRNSYYTYSRNNITFSGTGENTRESIEYPDSELRLFVNTIVKAERGANHKPDIKALENITEVPYNSNLVFNAIVKDVDNDKVRINKITVDGNPVNGYLTPTQYKDQGAAFPVTISENILKERVNQEVKIVIEAEDIKGAVVVKEYKIKPIRTPLLTSNEKKINSLLGENIYFEIKLNRENDTNPSGILIKGIETPQTFGKFNLKEVSIKEINGEYYLVGTLTALAELKGEEIPIIVNYSNGGNELKKNEAKIILNSKNANVNVIVKGSVSNNSNLGIAPKITLLNTVNGDVYEKNVSITDGQLIFDKLDSGTYKLSISDLVGYTVTSIYINEVVTGSVNDIEFYVDFENSSNKIEIIVSPQASDLTHGLYRGINSEKIIDENSEGFEIAAGMNVNFGSTFILGSNNIEIKLAIDSYLDKFNDEEEVNKNNIKVYKIKESNSDITLSEFSKESLDIKRVNSEYSIRIKDNIESNSKILVIYSAKIPKNSVNKTYSNTIDVGGTSKEVKIYTKDYQNKSDYIPDLF